MCISKQLISLLLYGVCSHYSILSRYKSVISSIQRSLTRLLKKPQYISLTSPHITWSGFSSSYICMYFSELFFLKSCTVIVGDQSRLILFVIANCYNVNATYLGTEQSPPLRVGNVGSYTIVKLVTVL